MEEDRFQRYVDKLLPAYANMDWFVVRVPYKFNFPVTPFVLEYPGWFWRKTLKNPFSFCGFDLCFESGAEAETFAHRLKPRSVRGNSLPSLLKPESWEDEMILKGWGSPTDEQKMAAAARIEIRKAMARNA